MTAHLTEHTTDVRPPPRDRRRRRALIAAAVVVAVAVAAVLAITTPWSTSGATTAAGAPARRRRHPPPGRRTPSRPTVDSAALVAAVPAKSVAKIDAGAAQGRRRAAHQPLVQRPRVRGPAAAGLRRAAVVRPDGHRASRSGSRHRRRARRRSWRRTCPAVTVDAGAASAQISAADPVSVTIELLDASGAVLGHVVLAEGSPVRELHGREGRDRERPRVAGGSFATGDDGAQTADAGTSTWGLVGGGADGGSTTLSAGRTATWYALPPDAKPAAATALAKAAADPVTGVDVSYGVDDSRGPHHADLPHGGRVAHGLRDHAAPPHRRPADAVGLRAGLVPQRLRGPRAVHRLAAHVVRAGPAGGGRARSRRHHAPTRSRRSSTR